MARMVFEKPRNGIIISVIVTIALVFIPSLHQGVYGVTLLQSYDENGNCFNVYQNEDYNMFMSYPCTWTERIEPVPGVESILLSPLESPQDIYQESLSILVTSLPTQNMPSNALDIYAKYVVDNYRTQPVNFHLLSSEPMNLFPSIPAQKLTYTMVRDNITLQVMEIFTILDGNLFVFMYGAESDEPFYKYIPTIQNMLSTLEIGNNKVSSMSPLNVPVV